MVGKMTLFGPFSGHAWPRNGCVFDHPFTWLNGNAAQKWNFTCSKHDTENDGFVFLQKKSDFCCFSQNHYFRKKAKKGNSGKHAKSCFWGVKPLRNMMTDNTERGGYHHGMPLYCPLGDTTVASFHHLWWVGGNHPPKPWRRSKSGTRADGRIAKLVVFGVPKQTWRATRIFVCLQKSFFKRLA